MDCHESQHLMSAYLDGELDPASAVHYTEHLVQCSACNQAYGELLQLQATLKSQTTVYSAPAHLRHRIWADLNSTKAPRIKPKKLPWAWINFGAAAVCSFAFVMTLSLYLAIPTEAERINKEIVASHYRSLLANHLSDVASSDKHTVKPWFSGKLDYSPPVTDLTQLGYTLIGGRLDYIDQRSVAALVYRHGPHFMNLFVWPDKGGRDTSAKLTSIQGFQLLQWTQSGMTYQAISDMNAQELVAFRELLLVQASK